MVIRGRQYGKNAQNQIRLLQPCTISHLSSSLAIILFRPSLSLSVMFHIKNQSLQMFIEITKISKEHIMQPLLNRQWTIASLNSYS